MTVVIEPLQLDEPANAGFQEPNIPCRNVLEKPIIQPHQPNAIPNPQPAIVERIAFG
jgi:hypothetical protein